MIDLVILLVLLNVQGYKARKEGGSLVNCDSETKVRFTEKNLVGRWWGSEFKRELQIGC